MKIYVDKKDKDMIISVKKVTSKKAHYKMFYMDKMKEGVLKLNMPLWYFEKRFEEVVID